MNVIELKRALLEASRVSTTTKHRPLMTQAIGEIASLQAENERLKSSIGLFKLSGTTGDKFAMFDLLDK